MVFLRSVAFYQLPYFVAINWLAKIYQLTYFVSINWLAKIYQFPYLRKLNKLLKPTFCGRMLYKKNQFSHFKGKWNSPFAFSPRANF